MKYVGIDIGGTNLKAGLVDEFGNILVTRKMKVAEEGDSESVAWTLVQLTQDLAAAGNIPLDQIASVGVGVPGVVEVYSGSILYTCNLPLRNIPLRKQFHHYLGLPLYVENDANCAALAEYHIGAGRASKRFVTVTLGTGIGGGIIHNGKIYHGSNGMAGEVGHMAIMYGGEKCNCGRRGCWERYASATALKRMTQHALDEHPDSTLAAVVTENEGKVSGQSAFIAARQGDPVGQAVCDAYIQYLGMGIVNLINIFQPDTLAIGGGVSNEAEEQLLLPLRRIAARESIPCNRDKMTRIVKAELGNNAGLIGAALLGKKRDREKAQ
jgi:glucokinase